MSGRTAPIALEAAITKSILGAPTLAYGRGERSSHHAALFYDLIEFEAGLDRAKMAFGEGFLHCMAIKSNPISAILKIVLEKGHGIECASIGEVLHGLDIGFPPDRIVFDSPVKTVSELKFSLERGIFINVDNFQELEVITELRKEIKHTESTVGLRLRPIIGTGDVKALSVCTPDSKFGVALTDLSREQIISWFVERPWLKGVHVHIGSQSFDCASLCRGVKSIIDFALEVNQRVGRNQVEVIDIGGGLNVNRQDDTVRPSFQEYAEDLKKNVPELFPDSGVFKKVITEFGQALNAKAGWLASRVEYTKMLSDDLKLALIHFGADMMMRTCYCPDTPKYQRRVQVFENNGKPKAGKKCYHNIAGPLCFSGDVIKRSVLLPEIERGDFVVLHDCGANSLSTFSRHCSRFAPAVIGYRVQQDGTVNFRVLKEMETLEDLKIFWGGRKQEENSEW